MFGEDEFLGLPIFMKRFLLAWHESNNNIHSWIYTCICMSWIMTFEKNPSISIHFVLLFGVGWCQNAFLFESNQTNIISLFKMRKHLFLDESTGLIFFFKLCLLQYSTISKASVKVIISCTIRLLHAIQYYNDIQWEQINCAIEFHLFLFTFLLCGVLKRFWFKNTFLSAFK